MAAPQPYYIKGNLATPVLLARKIRQRSDGLDGGMARFLSNQERPFSLGQSLTAIPGLFVDDVDNVDVGGGLWEHECSVSGLLSGAINVMGYPDIKINLQDWDTVEDVWLTTDRHHFAIGQLGNYSGTTVCTSVNDKPQNLARTIWRVSGSFMGIIRTKPRQRSMSVNGQTVSGDKIVIPLPGGWTLPRKGDGQLPKVVVRDRYLGFTPPPTSLIPGPATPPNPPPIKILTVTGADVTQHWPGGWHLASLSGEQIADKGLYAVDWVYEYQYPYTP